MSGTPFFVFTMTRSGSTWLLTLLNGQPGVAAYEELFLPRPVEDRYAWVRDGSPERLHEVAPRLGAFRPRRIWRYLDVVEGHRADSRAYGFKLILGQLRGAPELLPTLASRRYRMLLLIRNNPFESAVSRLVSEATQDSQSREETAQRPAITLDPSRVVEQIALRRRGVRIMRAVRRAWPWPSVEIRYEDLVANQEQVMGAALRVIGVDAAPLPVQSPLRRRIVQPYDELIANYDQVAAAVAAAGHADALPRRTPTAAVG